MSDAPRTVVLTHAQLATSLIEAVTCIVGPVEGLVAVSNEGCNRDAIYERLLHAVGDQPAVVFVDLPGGSCYSAACRLRRERPEVSLVSGVNLPMLLDFVTHRDLAPRDAVAHAVEAGSKAIRSDPA